MPVQLIVPDYICERDYPAVAAIDQASRDEYWPLPYIKTYMRRENTIGYVTKAAGVVTGFLFYRVLDGVIQIDAIAVDPTFRRQLYGSVLLSVVETRIACPVPDRTAQIYVPEESLDAQLFLRANGWRAVGTVRGDIHFTFEKGFQHDARGVKTNIVAIKD